MRSKGRLLLSLIVTLALAPMLLGATPVTEVENEEAAAHHTKIVIGDGMIPLTPMMKHPTFCMC